MARVDGWYGGRWHRWLGDRRGAWIGAYVLVEVSYCVSTFSADCELVDAASENPL